MHAVNVLGARLDADENHRIAHARSFLRAVGVEHDLARRGAGARREPLGQHVARRLGIERRVEQLVERGGIKVVFEMTAVKVIDSSGVAIIVSLFKRLRALGGADEARRLGPAQGPGHLRDDGHHLREIEHPLPLQARGQVFPFEQLHGDVGRALPHPMIEDLHHVGAADLRRAPGLALEALAHLGGGRGVGVDELERTGDVQADVLRLPDGPHAPLAERALQAKAVGDDDPGGDHGRVPDRDRRRIG